ncbi:MAG: SWIM zinc finger family protein [Candidatus Lokiarchaeota archaeon]|nr:SWIM zinc finger family protein [Candidatus Lokiarchaeota archaeon]
MSKDYLDQLYSNIKENAHKNEAFIEHLEKLFPEQSDKILEVLERGIIKYTYNPSKKVVWMVIGENKKEYLLYPRIFCSCQDFYKNTVIKQKRPYCKHLIAQVISEALSLYEEKKRIDDEFNHLIEKLKSKF